MTRKKTLSVIGKPLRKVDAMAKCAGETVYADDLNLPRTIFAKLLRSPHPHARVLGVNTARALKLDGVLAVLTGENSASCLPPKMKRPWRSIRFAMSAIPWRRWRR